MRGGDSTDWKALYMGILEDTATTLVVPEGTQTLKVRLTSNSTLREVVFPSTLEAIYNYIFINLPINTPITIPSGVTLIGQQTFQGCSSIPYIIMQGSTPPTIYANTFMQTTFNFYVPDASVNDYKAANGWNALASRIFPLSDLNT